MRMALSYHGRWQNTAIPNDSINRVVLPRKGTLTRLIIEDIHLRLLHSGPSHTFLQLWMKHCILKARTEVKKILKIFLICVRHQDGSCNMKTMTPSPKSIVPESLALKHIILDYFEPLHIMKQSENMVWVCISTCITIRAIHLELIEVMTSEQYLLALRRFVACRRKPNEIMSDNATHFKVTKNSRC